MGGEAMALSKHALTTIEQAKYQINDNSITEGVVERLINAASDAIRRYCNRDFAFQTITENVVGYGSSRLMLQLTPVVAVAYITGPNGQVYEGPLDIEDPGAGFVVVPGNMRLSTGDISSGPLGMPAGVAERARLQVTYTGGYITPAQMNPEASLTQYYAHPAQVIENACTLPYDLEQACLQLVAAWHHERQRDPGVTSEKLGSLGMTYGIPTWMHPLLAPWKRVV